ncbi:methyltransferase domain-containing protein [Colletotrichum chrysophilum]|uniref:Methyltransferase domain-containing protein n=1 Tax=Colletotrichum chrysophilum TaxID=1836956 RepID=A0AAD9EJB5_9PEZI|nr:methyltransferase domain-containing protein [Colletotrichum chrysophilum]
MAERGDTASTFQKLCRAAFGVSFEAKIDKEERANRALNYLATVLLSELSEQARINAAPLPGTSKELRRDKTMAMEDPILEATHSADTVLPLGANLALEPDEEVSDADMQSNLGSDVDSALGESEAWPSSTASLRSSIVRAMEENGRIYHGYKDGKYVLPTDQEELDRQAFQYQLCQLTFENRLNFAPVYHPHRVLDVGCGIGVCRSLPFRLCPDP